jgi:hypothetical protein
MRTVVECLVIAALFELLYLNLTSIPKQDYIHNNPYVYNWARK